MKPLKMNPPADLGSQSSKEVGLPFFNFFPDLNLRGSRRGGNSWSLQVRGSEASILNPSSRFFDPKTWKWILCDALPDKSEKLWSKLELLVPQNVSTGHTHFTKSDTETLTCWQFVEGLARPTSCQIVHMFCVPWALATFVYICILLSGCIRLHQFAIASVAWGTHCRVF